MFRILVILLALAGLASTRSIRSSENNFNLSDIDIDALLKNLPTDANEAEPRTGKHGYNEPRPQSAAPPLPSLPTAITGTGAFIAKAAEVIDDLNTIAAISGQEVQDTRDAKKHLVQEKGEALTTILGLGQEFGQVTFPILSNIFNSVRTMFKYKTSLLRSFNQLRNRQRFKPDEDDLDLGFILG